MTQTITSPRGQKLHASGFGLPEFGQTGMGTPATDLADAGEDLLAAVWRTSSYVESVQWELDTAQGSLFRAVQQAAHSGVAHDELCKAANMTAVELAAALEALPVTAVP